MPGASLTQIGENKPGLRHWTARQTGHTEPTAPEYADVDNGRHEHSSKKKAK
jgi:hypothetical protein